MPLLRQIIASRREDGILSEGLINTDSTDPNHIGTTMRATAGELAFDVANNEYVTLDQSIETLKNIGDYVEFNVTIGENTQWLAGNVLDTSDYFYLLNSLVRIRGNSSGGTANTEWTITTPIIGNNYTYRIVRSSVGNFELFADGVSQGEQSDNGSDSIVVSQLGRRGTNTTSTITYSHADFNRAKFDFNETGNDPRVFAFSALTI